MNKQFLCLILIGLEEDYVFINTISSESFTLRSVLRVIDDENTGLQIELLQRCFHIARKAVGMEKNEEGERKKKLIRTRRVEFSYPMSSLRPSWLWPTKHFLA